jgi:DNA-binding transcriptional regulator GbsR (MarR family)
MRMRKQLKSVEEEDNYGEPEPGPVRAMDQHGFKSVDRIKGKVTMIEEVEVEYEDNLDDEDMDGEFENMNPTLTSPDKVSEDMTAAADHDEDEHFSDASAYGNELARYILTYIFF